MTLRSTMSRYVQYNMTKFCYYSCCVLFECYKFLYVENSPFFSTNTKKLQSINYLLLKV